MGDDTIENPTFFEQKDEIFNKATKSKENSLRNFLPLDQILYQESHATLIPPDHNRSTIDGDVIGLNTRFDKQAALGKFTLEDNVDESPYSSDVKRFGVQLNHCLELRDKYQNVSFQKPIANPLNNQDWVSYPRPQPKGWHYEDEYGSSDYYFDHKATPHYSGEKFDIDDYTRTIFSKTVRGDTGAQLTCSRSVFEIQGFEHPRLPNFKVFFDDLKHVIYTSMGSTGTLLSERRLSYLHSKFEAYSLLNEQREIYLTKLNPHRDFYNVRKVDNNIDMSMAMTKKHLLSIINNKLKTEPDRVVYIENGIPMTLEDIFRPYFEDGTSQRLNIDDLFELSIIDRSFSGDIVVLNESTSFDNILQNAALLRVDKTFLRIDNDVNGEYLSEILKQVLSDLEKSKYCFNELGLNFNLLSEYSKNGKETRWTSLTNWITDNMLISYNVKWVIRIPRNYSALRRTGKVNNFREFLDLVFKELFEISMNPQSNVKFHYFLTKISAFDLLSGGLPNENESLFDFKHLTSPEDWTSDVNPPYCYYLYYIFINLSNLNSYRSSRALCTFKLRPHAASITEKSGGGIITESLAANFLLSRDIINGERLHNYPVLEYLYYLKQIGTTISPLCWNKTIQTLNDDDRNLESANGASYEANPVIKFFKTGLRVSLSTNKPLFSSLTREPLIEEYSIAASIYKLSNVDLCELSRNSVLISGFNGALKKHWIGIEYIDDDIIDEIDTDVFAIQRSNVPGMRLDYRRDTLLLEHLFIRELAKQ